MAREACPDTYVSFSDACFYFGTHASYDDAQRACESNGARLVDIDARNSRYVKNKVTLLGGNDNWIGSYVVGGRAVRRRGNDNCPIVKGQNDGSGFYDRVSCNSAYPFICQKYGRTQQGNGNQNSNRFDPGVGILNGELERPVTTTPSRNEAMTSSAEEADSNSAVIATVVSIVVLIVLAIVIRYMCKRQSRKARKEKIKENMLAENKATLSTPNEKAGPLFSSATNPSLSRTSTINRPYKLPESASAVPASLKRGTSYNDLSRRQQTEHEDEIDYHNKYRKSFRKEEDYYQRRHSRSRERHLHGRQHSPPPAYGQIYRRDNHRSRSRRRSMSRRGSATDLVTSRYTGSSRSSSADSHLSDSAISRRTNASFRHSRRGRERHRSRHYSRHSPTSSGYYDDRERRYESRGSSHPRNPRRSRSRHKARSMYEQYAAGRPPSPILHRNPGKREFHDRDAYNYRKSMTRRGSDVRYEADLRQSRIPDTATPIYFPEMATAWSREDLRCAADFSNPPLNFSGPRQNRSLRQGPIRVNRHIHDFEMNDSVSSRVQSHESDHIYESLDEVGRDKSRQSGKHHSMPIQAVSLNVRQMESPFKRDIHRSSTKSRASLRSRDLPAIPNR